ncbi:hypothetical protein [Lichenibacterium dinghuense]|uniref:hypothetical protein n=1 Tax=Lichenibacterium dinghuense TaxID=2895977 RepID=UPI001F1B9CA3|nr:hypothetical protein [Lichenibacterium sp. 6Y81]
MLRRSSGLSRPVLKWVSQVAASLGATLSATLIWSAVPHPGAAPAAQPELTSGGKFAARAIQPVAYDGLDTMPLPRVAPAPARFVAASFEAPPAFDAAPRRPAGEAAPAAERRAAHAARPAPRAEARRAEPAPSAAIVTAATPVAAPEPEEGFLHRVIPSSLPSVVPTIASTAREAWSATASAGDALVSHIVPRMP